MAMLGFIGFSLFALSGVIFLGIGLVVLVLNWSLLFSTIGMIGLMGMAFMIISVYVDEAKRFISDWKKYRE